ncbi:Uncharacterized conserved protein YlxW, UPF0749 family [Alkalithermobacter thermoalcaliphilus JW-YL-7 = DSM 7308]|uniref:Uncharacterized conserved protein YlxW, UPF0749 family n=1 Tax=Alkalithermobacter thermoalcaliphilus JW-YL-7 = DSM 7308 TaxID=1121328 RepID=A0A150FRU9_CLOPD|nr:protein of unknown function DUF881 [[Clostridium] paradoxum JW-YL-7 = DSM 7308]SHK36898.1 Uncharacterized conserved protein YlxW, UPF0749 family [[Clostridium] paradoxum JW-YL-7 = DSM 7308]
MKNKYMSIIVLSILTGVLIGIQFKSDYQEKLQLSFVDRQFIGEINAVKRENMELTKKLNTLNQNLKFLEKNKISDESNQKLKEQVESLKTILGYKDLKGPGLIIRIDTKEDLNLAFMMEERKILISLINEARIYGAEAISINNQIITQYTEVTLAGNHININSVAVDQPYEIKIIGNIDRLRSYINENNVLIDTMINMYGLNVNITEHREIIINRLEKEKKIRHMHIDEDV